MQQLRLHHHKWPGTDGQSAPPPVLTPQLRTRLITWLFVKRSASFRIWDSVEILLNCVWLVLSLSLLTAWMVAPRLQVAHGRCAGQPELMPSRRLQFTAIIVLVLLLFPVISLTDDLAMCAATRDTEQALRLDDLCNGAHPQPAMLPSTLAWMEAIAQPLHIGTRRGIEQETHMLPPQAGAHLPLDSRPPPSSL